MRENWASALALTSIQLMRFCGGDIALLCPPMGLALAPQELRCSYRPSALLLEKIGKLFQETLSGKTDDGVQASLDMVDERSGA